MEANPNLTEKEAENIIREWFGTTISWHIRQCLYKEHPEVEKYAKGILERMAGKDEVKLVEDIDAAWVDSRGRTIARAFPTEKSVGLGGS